MKTFTHTKLLIRTKISILLMVLLVMSSTLNAKDHSTFNFPVPGAEKSVNDIPFDTHEIAIDYFFDKAMDGVELSPDANVNDIPFDTRLIQQMNLNDNSSSFTTLSPEKDANDIPFDTHEIVQEYRMSNISNSLSLKPECTVNDFPHEANVILTGANDKVKASSEFRIMNNIPDHVYSRLTNLLKAGLISMLILLSAAVLGFLFFSYVY
ncbi:MAG: hypothetical protein IH597_13255 [Bacteroidales bacterium]|nr:hypothetical protein [Bacteroidales bacterium]